MQLLFPIRRDATGWPRHGLVQRVMSRGCELRTVPNLLGRVIPEPVLIRLVALDNGMASRSGVVAGVLGWRRVAAADVTAFGATTQVKPPAIRGEARDAAGAAGRDRGIDLVHRHLGKPARCPCPSRKHEWRDREQPATGFAQLGLAFRVKAGHVGARVADAPGPQPTSSARWPSRTPARSAIWGDSKTEYRPMKRSYASAGTSKLTESVLEVRVGCCGSDGRRCPDRTGA